MADLAHDASGPASSEPAGIAQQVRQPASSDSGKLRVFISYSRDDLDFADQLNAALDAYGFECLIDRHGISGGEDWKRRLGNLISEADTVVFVLSPSSAGSPICVWEVEEAKRLNKRILPIVWRPLGGVSPPQPLQDRNYIFYYNEPKMPGSGFGTGLANLITALNTDFDWLREHTRYLQRAIEWDTGGRPANRLLSGNDILEAKAWAAARPKSAPEPTALQLDFIRASEEEAEARLSEQRKQLDAMAAAQAEREKALHEAEQALKQAADAQRRRTRIRNIALLATSGLAAVAVLFALLANQQRITADKERLTVDEMLFRTTTIIENLRYQMDSETKDRVFALFQAGAEHGNPVFMNKLCAAYQDGDGVPQDYAKARKWCEKAAAKGHDDAMVSLGLLYEGGQGVPQDHAKAREWFEKAAAKDNAFAMNIIGTFYELGRGVPQDYAKAHELYEKAAVQGACLSAEFPSLRGTAADACRPPSEDAMNNLGVLYVNGRGVPEDHAKAREWFEKAAARGNAKARVYLEQLPIHEAATAGRYDDALGLEEALAAKHEATETKSDGKPGEQTKVALNEVILWAVFAKDFTKALTVADRAHAFFPDNLSIQTNRANALMFSGHFEEAKALYLAHKGEPVPEKNNRLWEQIIADDFAAFRKAGLTHPMMADVEKELGISR
jgi:TPR repeat protein